jgi:hypothetical protein
LLFHLALLICPQAFLCQPALFFTLSLLISA